MVKIVTPKIETITLVRGEKKIVRTFTDYKVNKKMYEFRGFKPLQDNVKEEKVVKLKPKKTRKNKNEQMDNIKD